jgi:hypothetical protein
VPVPYQTNLSLGVPLCLCVLAIFTPPAIDLFQFRIIIIGEAKRSMDVARQIYHLNRKQKECIELGRRQIAEGDFISDAELNKEDYFLYVPFFAIPTGKLRRKLEKPTINRQNKL